ncbi:MAG: permease prefix domain 1-containing protein [Pyrinomonadaceae bacterium]
MKTLLKRLVRHLYLGSAESQVSDELQLHIDLSTQELIGQGMPVREAREMALKRLGNVEQIKRECTEIVRRRHPSRRALKFFVTLIFVAGVVVRCLSGELEVTHIGNTLIMVAILSGILIYVRGRPRSLSRHGSVTQLMLNEEEHASIGLSDLRHPQRR